MPNPTTNDNDSFACAMHGTAAPLPATCENCRTLYIARLRSRVFQTRGAADDAALHSARSLSATKLARPVLFCASVYQPREGGAAFEVEPLHEGWGVREVSAAELSRRIEGGMRREIDRLLEKAAEHAIKAEAAEERGSASFATIHRDTARDYHDMARTLETNLTLMAV